MKTENWNGHEIRFVEVGDEWWAVGVDVAKVLEYVDLNKAVQQHTEKEDRKPLSRKVYGDSCGNLWESENDFRNKTVISEFGVYDMVLSSKMPQAKQFKRWMYSVIKQLRQSAGLEGFEIFRMMDKEHQKEMMANLQHGLRNPTSLSYIKANTIADKAVSTAFGFPKKVSKTDMTPEMLKAREGFLEETVEAMKFKEKYGLDLHVNQLVYSKIKQTA